MNQYLSSETKIINEMLVSFFISKKSKWHSTILCNMFFFSYSSKQL